MPEEAFKKSKTTKTIKTDEMNQRLDELIYKLENRLAIFNDGELKNRLKPRLQELRKTIDLLEQQHQDICDLLGLNYQEIHLD